jgi:hypothetical protein
MLGHNEIVEKILERKFELEKKGLKPRVILLGNAIYEMIVDEWIESIKELPWGDTLMYEMERKKEAGKNVFLGDGSMFGLWIIRVDTLDGFKVY